MKFLCLIAAVFRLSPSAFGSPLPMPASSRLYTFLALLGLLCAAGIVRAQPSIEVDFTTPKATYGLNDPVPTSITIRNTTPPASGDDSAANDAANARNTARNFRIDTFTLQGRDIYGNAVNVVVPGFDVGDVGPGSTITRNYDFTIPNDGTLHDVNDPGYNVQMAYRWTDPVAGLRIGTASTFQDILISVRPDLALNTITYTAGSYRGGDVLTFRAVITNNRNGEPGRQGRPLRPSATDQYRFDTRLSIAPAFDEDLPNEFNVFLADLFGDQGLVPFASPPNQRTTIRQIRVINTPGTVANPALPPAYGVTRTASATITVNAAGAVSAISVTGRGAGYVNGQPVSLQGTQVTGGALFAGTAVVNATGQLTGVTIINGGAGYPANSVVSNVTVVTDAGRNYNPQPADGFLDLGETMEVVFEVRMPDNWPGVYFVCGQVDSLSNLVEPRPTGNEVPYPDTVDEGGEARRVNNNTFVSSTATRILIQSSAYPSTELISGVQESSTQSANFGNNPSDLASVSGLGEWVAFASFANNLLSTGRTLNGKRQIYIRQTATREINLASANDAGVEGNANSYNPAFSANGRYVAFESAASNLVPRDFNNSTDIFVRDVEENRTVRVSINRRGAEADGSSFNPSISSDGRYVAFESKARNLESDRSIGAGSGSTLVYVHNRAVDPDLPFDRPGNTATYLVSVSRDNKPANAFSYFARISGNGKAVAYASYAMNLPGGQGYEQVFAVNLEDSGAPKAATTELISKRGSALIGNGPSYQPSINGDGKQIAFTSEATNLVADDTNDVADVFVRDRNAGRTVRVSVSNPRLASGQIIFYDPAARRGVAPANNPADGDRLTIGSVRFTFRDNPAAANDVQIGVNGGATRDNLVTAINNSTLDLTATASTPPPAGNPKAPYSPAIYLLANTPGTAGNLAITTTSAVLLPSNMTGGGTQATDPYSLPNGVPSGSITPSIDSSGRYVAFRSVATDLVVAEPTPENNFLRRGDLIRPQLGAFADVYVHDRDVDDDNRFDETGNVNTEIVSVSTFGNNTGALLGQQSSGNNQMPSISADGRFIGFSSDSENRAGLIFGDSNLVPQDFNRKRDVFLRNRNLIGDSTPPTNFTDVTITSPEAEDQTYITSSVILLNAEVTPARGKTITQVQFVVNGTPLSTATSSPYTAVLTADSPGTYNLTVTATDNFGVQTSAFRRILVRAPVGGEAPVAAVVHPTPGGGGDTANDFSVASSFYLNAVAITGGAASTDFVSSVKVIKSGSGYKQAPKVELKGGGGSGAEAEAEVRNGKVVAIKVTKAGSGYTSAPVVSFSEGGGGKGARATAKINAPRFFANGELIRGTIDKLGDQYGIQWRPSSQGNYNITVELTDSLGNTVVSAPLNFVIGPVVRPLPTVTMRTPFIASREGATAGSEILLEADYSANGITPVSRVDFYANGVYIGAWEPGEGDNALQGRASIVWIPGDTDVGKFNFTARVMQVLNEVGDNSIISDPTRPTIVEVKPPPPIVGKLPLILLTDPVAESTLARGSRVYLNVTATDPDPSGFIADKGVRILVDGQELDAVRRYGDTWSAEWFPNASGSFIVQATAEDNDGNVAVLPRWSIVVQPAQRPLPVVIMENIVAGKRISTSQPVTLQAKARFPTNSPESRVDFYANGVLLGSGVPGAATPDGFVRYSFDWSPSYPGRIRVSAKATAANEARRDPEQQGADTTFQRFASSLSQELAPIDVLDIGDPAPGTDGAFVRESYEQLLYREPLYEDWKFYVDRLASGRMDEADVIMSIMGFDPASNKFNYRTPYGRTSAMAFAPYARLGITPNNNLIEFFLSMLASDDALLPLTVYPAPDLAPPPYGATIGLAKAMQEIFTSRVFLQKYPPVTALSQGNFVRWLQKNMFPDRPLGRLELLSGTSASPGLMDNAAVAQPDSGLPFEEGAATAFLSRLVVASYAGAEGTFQRRMNVSALLFQLTGRWDLNAYKTYGLYSKQAVQKILASLPAPVGGTAADAAAARKRQLANIAGSYSGKLDRAAANKWAGGDLRLAIGKSGQVSGSLKVNGRTLKVVGVVDSNGRVTASTLPSPGQPAFVMNLTAQKAGTVQAKLAGQVRSGSKVSGMRAGVKDNAAVRALNARKIKRMTGRYEGVVHRSVLNAQAGGSIRINSDAKGVVTGQVRINGKTLPFRGKIAPNGRITARTNAVKGASRYDLVLQMAKPGSAAAANVTGALSTGKAKATVRAHISPWGKRKAATNYQGSFRVEFKPAPAGRKLAASVPKGARTARLVVHKDGRVTLTGRLGNQAPIAWTGRLAGNGRVLLQSGIKGQGSVVGTLAVSNKGGRKSVSGALDWTKPAAGRKAGFKVKLQVKSASSRR